jgi:AraC family ethanolamine operon transcriptional activator
MQLEYFFAAHHFRDFDEFAQTTHAWNLNIRQLERGSFKGDLLQFGTGDVQAAHAAFQPGTFQQGEPPQGLRTLCILSDPSSHLIWRRKSISANTVMAFPPGAELDAVSIGGELGVFTLSFSDELLECISTLLGYLDLEQLLNGEDVITVIPQVVTELRRFLHRICRELQKNPAKLETPPMRYELEFELPRKFLSAFSCSREKMPKPNIRMRDLALRRIEDYLEEFPNNPHTVRDLCRVANVSERTLQYAFRERFGMPPKSLLLALRLNGMRRELKNPDTMSTTITDLATRWGFWHMSQFAADYRQLFGELPSATRKNSRSKNRTE